jgi:hypothetical protein
LQHVCFAAGTIGVLKKVLKKRKLAGEEGINTENVKRLRENSNPNFRWVKRF